MKAAPGSVKKRAGGNDNKTDFIETPLAETKYKEDSCSINDVFVFHIL